VNVRFRTQPIPNGAFRNTQISAYCPIKQPLPFQRYDIFTYRLRNPRTSQLFSFATGIRQAGTNPLADDVPLKFGHSHNNIEN
jgi:hypothetical protein